METSCADVNFSFIKAFSEHSLLVPQNNPYAREAYFGVAKSRSSQIPGVGGRLHLLIGGLCFYCYYGWYHQQ
jgi:hypothetical protein